MRLSGAIIQLLLLFSLSRYLSWKELGLWSFFQSIALIVSLFDFGASSSLQNELIFQYTKGDEKGQKTLFLSTFYCLLLISSIIYFLTLFLPLNSLWKVTGASSGLFAIVIFLQNVKSALQVGKAGFSSRQQTVIYSLFETGGLCISGLSVFIGTRVNCSLESLIILYFTSLLAAPIIAFWLFLKKENWNLEWVLFNDQLKALKKITKSFSQLWLLNLFSIGVYSVDTFIINGLFGLENVATFSLFQKLFNGILLLTLPITTASWAAFSLSFHAQDYAYIKRWLLRIFLTLLLISFTFGVLLVYLHPFLFKIWVNKSIQDIPLAVAFALYSLILSLNCIFSSYLNSIGIHKIQVIANGVGIFVNAGLSILLGKHMGVSGVVYATVFTLIPLFLINVLQTYHSFPGKNLVHTE